MALRYKKDLNLKLLRLSNELSKNPPPPPPKRFLNTRLGLRENLLVRFRLLFHKYGSLRDLQEACLS